MSVSGDEPVEVSVTVNGERFVRQVEPRRLLSDFLRRDLGLTGTHVGCEHGVCGACSVLVDGESVRSCLMLAVQTRGRSVLTVEGLAPADGPLHPVQQAFHDAHGLQCGFCTPGLLMTLVGSFSAGEPPSDDQLLDDLCGHLCRCTGYQGILEAARAAREAIGSRVQ